jgi:hypothetical protein
VCDLFLLLLSFLWSSADCDFGPTLLLLAGVLKWVRFSFPLAGLFPFCFSVSALLLGFVVFRDVVYIYVNLCCLSLYLRFCLCFMYRVFLCSGLYGFAAKTPDVVELYYTYEGGEA